MPAVNVPPVAADAVTDPVYVPTAAVAAAPVPYAIVTEPIVWPFCNPIEVKAVEPAPPVMVVPKFLVTLLAVMVSCAGSTIKFPLTYTTL